MRLAGVLAYDALRVDAMALGALDWDPTPRLW
jgi:hypothetical protein